MAALQKLALVLWLFPNLIFGQPFFTDVTDEAGISHIFHVFDGTFGGGASVLDYNLDGFEDVFITGGNGNNHLYKNKGDGTFENVSVAAGLKVLNGVVTQGATSADVNKDGYPDLYITTIASVGSDGFNETVDYLLINNGNGTFSNKAKEYGIVRETFSTGASFADVNRDGYPDLFVGNYFQDFEGKLDQYSGTILNETNGPAPDLLYINNSGLGFVESSEAYGIAHMGLGFQGVWSDMDNDRDLDLLVANDFGNRGYPNYLYRNEYPEKKFTDISEEKAFDYGINAMGIGVGDYNMDGWMDYMVTNIQRSPFFINRGSEIPFDEKSVQLGTAYSIVYTNSGAGVPPVSWGVNFFDADLDMDLDLYVTNGCLNPTLAPNPNLFLENIDGTYLESGYITNTNDHSIGRGAVIFDYDNDGDLDILVVNQIPYENQDVGVDFVGTRLYRNENSMNNWLKIKLNGVFSETSGIGSRVEAYVGPHVMVREVDGGSGHLSQSSTIAHFGLGIHDQVDSVIIKWSGFSTQKLYNITANQTLNVKEKIVLSTSQVPDADISVYPVPTEDWLFVKVNHLTEPINSIELITQSGKTISNLITVSKIADDLYQIEMNTGLTAGIYILRLMTVNETFNKQIIKIR